MTAPARRVLVASDSHLARDPRVLKQIRWLHDGDWTVDTLGRGERPPGVTGEHFTLTPRPFAVRLLASLLPSKSMRYRLVVQSSIPAHLRSTRALSDYDLAVINEVELLPWFTRTWQSSAPHDRSRRAHLDLHEYSFSQRSGLVHAVLFRRYREWLAGFVSSELFTSRSTVSPGLARRWAERLRIAEPSVVRNAPDYVDHEPVSVDPMNIKLIYHGSAAPMRRVDLLVEAMASIDSRFSLHLMLVGKRAWIESLKSMAHPLGSRVAVVAPVGVADVARALREYDLEVIFAPPKTDNIEFGLPNKFFEAVQGRLGIVTGEAPDKAALVRQLGNGVVVDGWEVGDLVRTINHITSRDVDAWKLASHRAAAELNSGVEATAFRQALDTAP